MAELLAAFADFAMLSKHAIHRADRAVVDAFIEQARVDFGRRLVCEARRIQQLQYHLLLRISQCSVGFASLAGRIAGGAARRSAALTLARDTPSAAQTAAVMPRSGCECYHSLGQVFAIAAASAGCPTRAPYSPSFSDQIPDACWRGRSPGSAQGRCQAAGGPATAFG